MWMEGGKMTKQANKQSIILPFFPVKGVTAYCFKAHSARFVRVGCAFLRHLKDGAKIFPCILLNT